MIGKTISHYKIIEKLGEGGMGEVYLADDLKLDRKVAIKFLPEHLTKDKENVERFEREAKAAASLNHPNIVTIHEIAEENDQTFIVMEYVEGKLLRDVINEYKMELDKIIDVITQISEGLSKAHKAGIVHRDIKPENIIIDNDARVKILDFGLAKLKGVSKLTKDSSTLGTVNYMSPEQIQGKDVDQRSDIWSVGVVLYELLTGEVPFKGEYESSVHYAILNEEPKLLKDIKAKYSFDIGKLLEREPNKRFQSCREVLRELDNINISGPKKRKPKNVYIVFGVIVITSLIITSDFFLFYQEDEDKTIKSLAVLPLENLSNDPTQEYFVDGITDVLISELAQISVLKVISRTSVMQYKGIHKSLTKIAEELNVDAIVEGAVYTDGEKVRISTQLIRAADDRHLWAEKYEYDITNIFSLQTEVAQAIAGAVEVQLTDQETTRITTVRHVDPETYQLYLKGRYHWNERTEEGILKAIDYFKHAIEKDSNYAVAYAGLADCYVIEPTYHMALPNEAFPKARAAALRALEIDDKLAEAYTSLAGVRHSYDWAWSDAETLFKKAISLNPNYATAHHWYAELLSMLGRHEEALREIKRAIELDPLSPIINMQRAYVYYASREYGQAIKQFKKALELHPNFYVNHEILAYTYSYMNMHEEAIRAAQKANALSENPRNIIALGYVYAMAGKKDKALQILDSMMKLSNQKLIQIAVYIALLYISLNDNDHAFHWLEKAYEQRDYWLTLAKVEPRFDPVRSDPRFIELLKKIGLDK
jgi:serine/threonine-protein kinase